MIDFWNNFVLVASDGEACVAIVLELTPAFDVGAHSRLLSKVRSYRVTGRYHPLIGLCSNSFNPNVDTNPFFPIPNL